MLFALCIAAFPDFEIPCLRRTAPRCGAHGMTRLIVPAPRFRGRVVR
jgi:hypothetical protein